MKKDLYVGCYSNCRLIYKQSNIEVYKWYDKMFIVEKICEYSKILWPFGGCKIAYNVIELAPEVVEKFNFEVFPEYSESIAEHFFDNIRGENKVEELVEYLNDSNRYTFYEMKYLKFKTENDDVYKKYNVHFYKLNNDMVEMLEVW